MKILVVGSGGREHAILWKLKASKKVQKLFCAPGNGGIAQIAKCVPIEPTNIRALSEFAHRNRIDLTVIGPESSLAAGVVDEFNRRKLKIFGPDKKAARLESSKCYSKEFMRKYHIPTAPFRSFSSAAEAIGFCRVLQFPTVIKADGLAAGKGVVIAHSYDEAVAAIERIMFKGVLGSAGDKIVIEACQTGPEVSLLTVTDGKTILPLLSSQDHKRAFDGDKGPNTGGMGAYCPTDLISAELMEEINDHILVPTLKGLNEEGFKYKGILYFGLMLTESGPKVLEYNCRFGDPETQAVLPLLKNDFSDLLKATVNGSLAGVKLDWSKDTSACVVMASRGYPGKYKTGLPIGGLQQVNDSNVTVFHAGTALKNNRLITSGGRVVAVTATDKSLSAALKRAYQAIEKIRFNGAQFRRDIGRTSKPIPQPPATPSEPTQPQQPSA